MAGYSPRPLRDKLGIKEGQRVRIEGAPDGYLPTLELPPSVHLVPKLAGEIDLVQLFVRDRKELARLLPKCKGVLPPAGSLWVSWPKRTSGVDTDVTEDVVREMALAAGLVDVKVCAVDDVWSGLKLVYRTVDRPKVAAAKAAARRRA